MRNKVQKYNFLFKMQKNNAKISKNKCPVRDGMLECQTHINRKQSGRLRYLNPTEGSANWAYIITNWNFF